MKHFKFFLAVILSLTILLSSVSCSFLFTTEFATTTEEGNSFSPTVEDVINGLPSLPEKDHKWSIIENCTALSKMLSSASPDAEKFMELYEKTEEELYYLSDCSSISYILFSTDTTKTEHQDLYNEYADLYSDCVAELIKLYKPIYESPLKDTFYEGWEEEEIVEAVAASEKMTDRYVELTKEQNRLETEYEALDQDSPDFNKESGNIYAQLVKVNNELAKEYGYNSYVDYAYKDVYDRDYSAADAQKSYAYISKYILPLADSLLVKMQSYLGISQVSKDMMELSQNDITVSDMESKLSDYYAELGKEYTEALTDFAANSTIVNSQNAMEGAYTVYLETIDTPRCYFGPGYQSLTTYLHEQGHYNAFLLSGTQISSLDLCEVHSQGNEWLYLAYSADDYTKTEFKYLSYYYFYNQIFTIVLSACCDAFEQYVYTHPELTAEQYDAVFIAQAKAIGAYDFLVENLTIAPEDYWHLAIISNSMYYFSYAISLIPAVELFVIAQDEGFSVAKNAYIKLCTVEEDVAFVETVTASGLSNPTSEEAYQRIYNYFSR